jgi:hypothetical protein
MRNVFGRRRGLAPVGGVTNRPHDFDQNHAWVLSQLNMGK